MKSSRNNTKGTALLAVLWLVAALSAIAFSVAGTVRSEAERAITQQESLRAYYLARGGIDRMLYLMKNDTGGQGGTPEERFAMRRRVYFREQTGDVIVELISARSKFPLRMLGANMLERFLGAIGESPASASAIAQQAFNPAPTLAFSQNSPMQSAFYRPPASMENVEELLMLPGITPELVFGRYTRMPNGNLMNMGGLADFLTPNLKDMTGFDPLGVHPSLLVAMGTPRGVAEEFARQRRSVFPAQAAISAAMSTGPGVALTLSLGDTFEIRSTGRPRLADGRLAESRRTVSMLVRYTPPNPRYVWINPWTHLRWYDQSSSDLASNNMMWVAEPADKGIKK